jgi:hypothetical protein
MNDVYEVRNYLRGEGCKKQLETSYAYTYWHGCDFHPWSTLGSTSQEVVDVVLLTRHSSEVGPASCGLTQSCGTLSAEYSLAYAQLPWAALR